MIIVTGAAGFIASQLAKRLNDEGYTDLILVDDFSTAEKRKNWKHLTYNTCIDRGTFFQSMNTYRTVLEAGACKAVFHLGARTDTTCTNAEILNSHNLHFSQHLFEWCTTRNIPFIYASSAATYGAGERGYSDNEALLHLLLPLNMYGQSKQDFDVWLLQQSNRPAQWAGFKFFNVFGYGEFHKGRMASVVLHAYRQIRQHGCIRLFKSYKKNIAHGMQMRDFIWVEDVLDVLMWCLKNKPANGIYNLGTGKAASFNQLAHAIFNALQREVRIQYIEMPLDIRDKYQYYTQADMAKLRAAGYNKPFTPLEQAVHTYVNQLM